MIIERLTVNPVRTASPVTLIIITVGVSIIIRGIALLDLGSNTLFSARIYQWRRL